MKTIIHNNNTDKLQNLKVGSFFHQRGCDIVYLIIEKPKNTNVIDLFDLTCETRDSLTENEDVIQLKVKSIKEDGAIIFEEM